MSAAAAMMVGGGAISAFGQLYQGRMSKYAADYNANVAEQNAQLSLEQSKEEERRFRAIARKQLGDARASVGASGVSFDGSVLDVLEDSAAQAELDALSIRHQGEVKSQAFRNEANLQRFYGRSAIAGSYLGAAGSLLGSTAQASYYGRRG